MANEGLGAAKKAKNDEFYTQYHDIEKEMNAYLDFNPDIFRGKTVLLPCDDPEWSNFTKYFAQNFERLGLKKLISTSYAPDSKPEVLNYQPTLFETEDPKFDTVKTRKNGKIFTLYHEIEMSEKIDVDDLKWDYLQGDGDFRSREITRLRDEADLIITNPPFSLFREFWSWLIESDKKFVVLGNMNAITYKEVFPHLKGNRVWTGTKQFGGGMNMIMPSSSFEPEKAGNFTVNAEGQFIKNIMGVIWFTNIDHGRRHEPLSLLSVEDNKKFHSAISESGYLVYDNYDAIEVPRVDAIPADYSGLMGVPITFLSKYNPDQFEILGMCENLDEYGLKTKVYSSKECRDAYAKKFGKPGTYDLNASGVVILDGLYEKVYQRILIRHKS